MVGESESVTGKWTTWSMLNSSLGSIIPSQDGLARSPPGDLAAGVLFLVGSCLVPPETTGPAVVEVEGRGLTLAQPGSGHLSSSSGGMRGCVSEFREVCLLSRLKDPESREPPG